MVYRQATKKPGTWIRVQCPKASCKKRLGDLYFNDEDRLVPIDVALEAESMDRKAPLTWSKKQWDEHFRKKEMARKILDEDAAELWPTVKRAPEAKLRNPTLGIRGPRTQYDGIKQVGDPYGKLIIELRFDDELEDESEDSAEAGGVRTTGHFDEDSDSKPWVFKCSCDLERIIGYEKLADLAKKALARNEHRLTLP